MARHKYDPGHSKQNVGSYQSTNVVWSSFVVILYVSPEDDAVVPKRVVSMNKWKYVHNDPTKSLF